MTSADLTRRALTLGAQDSTTGWYAPSYAETTIHGIVRPKGAPLLVGPFGRTTSYDHTLYTNAIVYVGDQIKDAANRYYRVESVQFEYVLDSFSHRVCGLSEITMEEARHTTSGTWHQDSDSVNTDPRNRIKAWLEAYDTPAAILEDDGATQASLIYMFAQPPPDNWLYPIFITKAVDVIVAIDKVSAEALYAIDKKPYAFIETVPVHIYSIDKTEITATNLIEQVEQDIRHIATDYPTGSLRSIESVEHKPVNLGECQLYSTTVNVKYKRANDDFVPSTPTFSSLINWTYEGDRLAAGSEGTWTLTDGGSTLTSGVNSENNLYFTVTVFAGDSNYKNGTNLGISTTTYTRIRFRYKTSGSATAKIIVGDDGAYSQTVLSETASTSWTVGDVALTTAKTLDHVTLYCCDDTGSVYYDYVQIYGTNYILPNVIEISTPAFVEDAVIPVPGRSGSIDQALGSKSLEVRMKCDLNIEHTDLTWKRPQTTTPKSDVTNAQILYETLHLCGADQDYPFVWLDLGDPPIQMKARLVEVNPVYGEADVVELVWREYRHGTAGSESTTERFGLSL